MEGTLPSSHRPPDRGRAFISSGSMPNPHPRPALGSDGKPFRLQSCEWVSNSRLVCTVFGLQKVNLELVSFTRLVAVDADGSNLKLLSTKQGPYARGLQLYGGEVLDLLPDEDGIVLMARVYLPDDHLGSHIGSAQRGLGVDRIDTRTLQRTASSHRATGRSATSATGAAVYASWVCRWKFPRPSERYHRLSLPHRRLTRMARTR